MSGQYTKEDAEALCAIAVAGYHKAMSYTPGPWSVDCQRNRPGAYNNISAPGRDWPESNIGLVSCDNPHYQANCALISAAPDLLDCCVKALAAWEGTGPAILLDDLRAAIKKATGHE